VSEYSDIQKAVRVEKFRIWFAWVSGGFVGAIVANGTSDVPILGVITLILFLGLGVLSTVAAVTMTSRLNKKAAAARREVLGDL
jgi:hypothetical protein